MSTAAIDRTLVERLVREAISQRTSGNGRTNGNGHAAAVAPAAPRVAAAPKLVVNVSARHCHVTQEDLERLFGKGHQLHPLKWLYQDGFFAAEESVTMIGPRNRIITGLRILGPCRDHSQVELAFTDAVYLGLDIPVRKSGDHRDSPGCYLMGPAGMVHLKAGVIRHERHVHMGPADAAYYGVKDGDRLNLRVKGDCGAVLEGLLVRQAAGIKLEVHIDTDEGNAVNYPKATGFELFK
ncbi:MAG: phosphate propanoyltransferase [Gemmataceae bacterium]